MNERVRQAKDRILVALDVDTLDEALKLVGELKGHVGGFKVGMQLCNKVGTQQTIDAISKAGGAVFVDLKFKDIPNTVYGASRSVSREGVLMFNVHCDGGVEMMAAAAKAAQETAAIRPLTIGVTVLTSMDQRTLNEDVRVPGKVLDHAVHLAKLAKQAGLDGVVCSPHEIAAIKEACGSKFITVVPGIRPAWAAAGDQKRIMTPGEAVSLGADYLVIGRPITSPPADLGSPANAAKRITEELEHQQAHVR